MSARAERRTGAAFARGASKQDYSTPDEFIAAVKNRFGLKRFDFDLAATPDNAKAKLFFDERKTDALKRDWTKLRGELWLNPPFGNIAPWAQKCADTAGRSASHFFWPFGWPNRRIYFLVPAAVGSNWFAAHVHERARVYFLNGRLSFDGKNPYPKDCILAVYDGCAYGYQVWDWRKDAQEDAT